MILLQSGITYSDRAFDKIEQQDARIEEAEFDSCVFERCDLERSAFMRCRFTSCRFVECDLSVVQVTGSRFRDVRFDKTKLLGVDWTKAEAMADPHAPTSLTFSECILDLSSFFGLNLRRATLDRCSAKEADFAEADLREAICRGTNFDQAKFHGTDLERADLTRASNYVIDPRVNKVKGARFSLPEAVALLRGLGVVIE